MGNEAQKLEVKIERLLPGGVGLAHANDLTLFVSLAAPGDVLRVRIDRVQGKIGFASVVEVLKPASVRVEPPCPYFGRCGGCDFQQLTYQAQLDAKLEIIRDCLHRIAKSEAPLDITMHASPGEWRYRARANWQVDSATKLLGYFERGSNRVCDVEYCAVLVPKLQETLEHVRHEILADAASQQLRDIDAVVGDEGVSVAPPLAGFQTDIVSRSIGNERYYFSAEAFFQVNDELLASVIAEALGDAKGLIAIDLYCGVGLFTLPLARRFERVTGVEAHPRAADFARRNVESTERSTSTTVREGVENGFEVGDPTTATSGNIRLGNVQIVTARVGDWLSQHSRSFGPVDFLLLDPPRTGCENRDITGIIALHPAKIAYVSCDPATLARDLKKLIAAGYSLDSVGAFDMFPQTHHVETVARLSNRQP
ncbi:MAG TPA: class I SAM-dependent RNA methyltransferase [Pyrinomonadaceae bacterium]